MEQYIHVDAKGGNQIMFRSRKSKKLHEFNKTESFSLSSNTDDELVKDLSTNEQVIKGIFQNCSDLVSRHIQANQQTKILLVYIDGMVDIKTLEATMLKSLFFEGLSKGLSEVNTIGEIVEQGLVAVTSVKK